MGTPAKVALTIAGVLVGGFVLLAIIGSRMEPESSLDRIKEGCKREFGYRGETAVNDCVLQLMVRKAREIERDKLDRAYR